MFNRVFYRRSSRRPADASWTDLTSANKNGAGGQPESPPGSPNSASSRSSQLLDLARSDSDALQSVGDAVREDEAKEEEEEDDPGQLESGGNSFAFLSLRWRPSLLVRDSAA